MKAVVDRIVQYANRYQLTNVETGEVLGTFDFEEVTGTVQQVGTEIDKELFDSIANDLAARVKLSGGELAGTVVTFSDISGTAANVASGDTSATLWGKVKNWFSRLKALAFKNKVAAGDFEAGAIKNADVAADAAIAQSKVSGLMTDYVASISASGRTVTYKNKNGVNMGSITTQDTTYELASQSSSGLMSSTDKTKLDGIESGAQRNTVLGVKGSSESAYRTGNVNITKANIGLGNVDNTSDEDKPVSKATQTALNGKANTNGTYPNLTVGKATNADKATNATNATNAVNATKATQDANGNVIDETYATKSELMEATGTKVKVNGTTQPEVDFTSDPQTQINDKQTQIDNIENGTTQVGSAAQADKLSTTRNLKVNLASGNQQSFDGSADATEIGVKGILPVGNGGTGMTDIESVFVRTDKSQGLTIEEKQQALNNVGRPYKNGYSTQKEWLRAAKISFPYAPSSGGYNIVFLVGESNSYMTFGLLQLSGTTSSGSGFYETFLRYINFNASSTQQFDPRYIKAVKVNNLELDLYIKQTSTNYTIVGLQVLSNFGEQKPDITVLLEAADDPGSGDNVTYASEPTVRANYISSNGSPVLVGSAPTWVSGTSGSLTLPSAGWYIFRDNGSTGYQDNSGIVYFPGNNDKIYRYPTGNSYYVVENGNLRTSSTSWSIPVAYYKLA